MTNSHFPGLATRMDSIQMNMVHFIVDLVPLQAAPSLDSFSHNILFVLDLFGASEIW
jgi:hypothetical protein